MMKIKEKMLFHIIKRRSEKLDNQNMVDDDSKKVLKL